MKRGLIFALIGVFVLAIAVVLITALSGKNASKTDNTLTIWSPFDEGDVYKQISEQFLLDNPTVKLSFKYVQAADAKDYEAKVVDAIASGTGPDIWLIRTDWLSKHQTKLIPSTKYISLSKTKNTEAEAAQEYFGTSVANQNIRSGALYGFPLAIDSLALYINTKVVNDAINALTESSGAEAEKLNTAPATWDEMSIWSRLLTKKDARGNISVAGMALGTTGNTYAPVDSYLSLLTQYGGALFTNDEKGIALHLIKIVDGKSQTPGLQALTTFSSFARAGDPNYSWNASMGDPVNAFVNNRLAVMLGYSTLSQDILKAKKDFNSGKIAPLPQVSDPASTNKRVDSASYWTHVVSKYSNKPSTAWAYLQALGGTGSERYSQLTGKPSLVQTQDATAKLSMGDLGETELFAKQVVFAPTVFKSDWQSSDEIVQDMLNQALINSQSLQAAVDSAAERLKGLL
ncbi:MAG: extracellular solute-binding protein [Candidatus Berkelbacteria bacterium]|nr:extracellular solute-binding protein [Candidatus Berkelbacteria bacterium]